MGLLWKKNLQISAAPWRRRRSGNERKSSSSEKGRTAPSKLSWRTLRQRLRANRKNLLEKGMAALFFVAACASILAVALIVSSSSRAATMPSPRSACLSSWAAPVGGPATVFRHFADDPGQHLCDRRRLDPGRAHRPADRHLHGALLPQAALPLRSNRAVELLAGIPSIVYGFFGLVVIVPHRCAAFSAAIGKSILTASILLGIMILPDHHQRERKLRIRAVPDSYYEGALALGATP